MKRVFLLTFSILVFSNLIFTQENYQPSEKNLENREWFQDAKYLHLLDLKDENLLIPSFPQKIKSATYFVGGEKVDYMETDYGILLNIPKEKQENYDTILTIRM